MKAAVVNQSGRLEIWDVPTPKPGPYEVLCKMCYGATCAGTDIHLMDGQHPRPIAFPTILGHESVGRVVEVGAKVRNFRVGDLVSRVGAPAGLLPGLNASWGGFAELGIARDHWQMRKDGRDAAEWNAYRVNQIIHPAIDEKTAPMLITWRETLSYTNRVGIQAGDRVLLLGSGANALAFAAHCCNLGAQVIVVGSARRESVFRSFPICGYVDYRSGGLAQEVAALARSLSISLFDFMIDGVGGAETANALLPLLKQDGVFCNYGWNGRKSYGLNPFHAQRSFRVYADGYDEEESNSQVQAMVLSGRLRAAPWYDLERAVPLSEIADAYDRLRRHEALKYLIDLGGAYEEA